MHMYINMYNYIYIYICVCIYIWRQEKAVRHRSRFKLHKPRSSQVEEKKKVPASPRARCDGKQTRLAALQRQSEKESSNTGMRCKACPADARTACKLEGFERPLAMQTKARPHGQPSSAHPFRFRSRTSSQNGNLLNLSFQKSK